MCPFSSFPIANFCSLDFQTTSPPPASGNIHLFLFQKIKIKQERTLPSGFLPTLQAHVCRLIFYRPFCFYWFSTYLLNQPLFGELSHFHVLCARMTLGIAVATWRLGPAGQSAVRGPHPCSRHQSSSDETRNIQRDLGKAPPG